MASVSSTIALDRWDAIVKQTQPVFDDIESGDFTNRDLARVAQLLRKQSKLASTVFEQNLKLLSEQAKSYVPTIKQELAKIGETVSLANISKVVEAIYKELVAKNIKTIVDKLKEVLTKDVVQKFQDTAKNLYNDYAKFYGKVPVIDVQKNQVTTTAKKDASDTDGLMQKVYDSLANISKAIVDLPSNVSTQVAQDLLPKIKESLGDKNIAKDVSGESPADETVPLPPELQKKLEGQIDPNYWAKKGFIPWITHGIKDFLYQKTHTPEEIEKDIKDFIESYNTPEKQDLHLERVIPGLDIADDAIREARRKERLADIESVWGETDETKANKLPWWKEMIDSYKATRKAMKELKESMNDGFAKVKKSVATTADVIATATGMKFLAGIKGLVEGFHDKLEKKVDAIKKFASKTGNIFSTLLTGGILAYVLYNVLLKHIDWGKVGTKIIKAIFPGLNRNEDPSAPENQPDYHSETDSSLDGLRQGYGKDEKGNDIFTVQDEYGKFHTVHKGKDGKITTSTTDTDPRVMQIGEFKGYKVVGQGPLSDIDMDAQGEYTDYLDPKTGLVKRKMTFDDTGQTVVKDINKGPKVENKSLWQAIQDNYFSDKEKEKKKREQLTGINPVVPPSEYSKTLKDPYTGVSYDNVNEELARRALEKKGRTATSSVSVPPAAISRPIVQEPTEVKTVTLPGVQKSVPGTYPGQIVKNPALYAYDPMNLRTTRANGNRADDTLGLLNSRDF